MPGGQIQPQDCASFVFCASGAGLYTKHMPIHMHSTSYPSTGTLVLGVGREAAGLPPLNDPKRALTTHSEY